MILGEKIIKIRKDNKMSQEDFAEIFNVTRQTISSWENSKSYPDIETLIKISDKFNISLDILLKGDDKMIKDVDTKIKKYKIYKVIALIIIFVFILSNVIWFSLAGLKYNGYSKGMNTNNKFKTLSAIENDYIYSVIKPMYLIEYQGFLTVSEYESTNINDMQLTLFVWPSIFREHEYGVMIEKENDIIQIMIDKNGNAIDKNDKELIEENKKEIDYLLELAKKKWKLNR